jgi:hypothetical protein
MEHWLQRQGQRRRFFIAWAIFAVTVAGTMITVSLITTASIHAHALHGAPLWAVGLAILSSAIPAAVVSRAGRAE